MLFTARRLHPNNNHPLPLSQPARAQQIAPECSPPPTSNSPEWNRRARGPTTDSHQPRSPRWTARKREGPLECRAGEERAHIADCRLDGCEIEAGGSGQLVVEQGVPEGQGRRCGGVKVRE